MEQPRIEVTYVAAPDDLDLYSDQYQKDLWSAGMAFDGLKPSVSAYFRDDSQAAVISLGQITIALGSAVIGALGATAVAWIQSRTGRKVRVKIGDIEAEARTLDEVKALLALAEKTRLTAEAGATGATQKPGHNEQ